MLTFLKVVDIFNSYPELKMKKSTNGRVGFDYPGSKERQLEIAREIRENQDGSINGYINAKKMPQGIREKYNTNLDERLFIQINNYNETELRELIEHTMASMGWERNVQTGSVWVNIDIPLKKYVIHRQMNCAFLGKKDQSSYKGVGILLRDGGWLPFDSLQEAQDFQNIQYASYEYIEHC